MRTFRLYYFGNSGVGGFGTEVYKLLLGQYVFVSEFAAKTFVAHLPQEDDRGEQYYNYLTGDYVYNPWLIKEMTERELIEHSLGQGVYSYPSWPLNPPDNQLVYADNEDTSLVNFFDGRRIVQMKPGRYLNRFHKELNKVQVEYYARWWMDRNRPPREITGTVKFAMTEEEMVDAYSRGPDSCMNGKKAVRAYAGGDFAIAYFEMSSGEVGARVLVNTTTKTFGRIYPDPSEETEGEDLETLLRELEYTSIEENEDGFEGARFLKIPLPEHITEEGDKVDDRYDAFVMPYLDRGVYLDARTWAATRKPERMYRLSSDSTSGYMATIAKPCRVCGQPSLVQNQAQFVLHEQFGDGVALCPLHREAEKFRDPWNDLLYYGQPTYIDPQGKTYSKNTISKNLYVSTYSGNWFLGFETPKVRVDGDIIAESELEDYGARRSERYSIWTKKSEQELRDEHEPSYIRTRANEAYFEARDQNRWFYDREYERERGHRPSLDRDVEIQATGGYSYGGDIHRAVPPIPVPIFIAPVQRVSQRYREIDFNPFD